MKGNTISSRLVLHFPGFEAISATHQMDRLAYSTKKSAPIWNFRHERAALDLDEARHIAAAHMHTNGDGWSVDTRFVHFDWSDIVASYVDTPYPKSLFRYLPKFLAFFADGTNLRYFRASKRYWIFSIFPVFTLLGFLAAALLVSAGIVALLPLSGWAGTVGWLLLAAVFFLLLGKWPGDRLYLNLTINMAGFIREMAKGENPVVIERCQTFADVLVDEISNADQDEILISGHCLGANWLAISLAGALRRKPDLFNDKTVTVFAMASSIPRMALAPCGGQLREDLAHVMARHDLFWHEIQTKDDIISFYRADPFEILGISDPAAGYTIDRVRFKRAVEKQRYKKIRRSFYRTHRQYVLNYDMPSHYDFVLRCFGPLAARSQIGQPELAQDFARHGVVRDFVAPVAVTEAG